MIEMDEGEIEGRRKLRESNFPYYVTMTDKSLSGWGQLCALTSLE